jgi:hypothetical protein
MGSPRELVEQHRGVIPRRVRVVVRPCGVKALNARTRGQEGARVLGPRLGYVLRFLRVLSRIPLVV